MSVANLNLANRTYRPTVTKTTLSGIICDRRMMPKCERMTNVYPTLRSACKRIHPIISLSKRPLYANLNLKSQLNAYTI